MRFSASRIKTFKQCPLKFKLTYLLNLKDTLEVVAPATRMGLAFHETVELHLGGSTDALESIVDAMIVKHSIDDRDGLLGRVKNWMNYKDKNLLDYVSVATEEELSFNVLGKDFIAYLDLVVHRKDDSVDIYDWKTGAYRTDEHEFQMKLYIVGLHLLKGIPLNKIRVNIYFPLADRSYGPITLNRKTFVEFLEELNSSLEKIESATFFPAKKNFLCKNYCVFSGTEYCIVSTALFGPTQRAYEIRGPE